MKKLLSFLFVVLCLLSGCISTLTISRPSGYSTSTTKGNSSGPNLSLNSIYPIDHNDTITLKHGTYSGNLTIDKNGVKIYGQGVSQTTINGTVRIEQHQTLIANCTIIGDVYILGNQNTLQNVRVTGTVYNKGHQNSY